MRRNIERNIGSKSIFCTVVVLWAGVMVSAFLVVYSTFQSRQAVQKLEEVRRQAYALEVNSGQYLLEKSSWAAYPRIERIATEELNMLVPEPNDTILVMTK